MFSSLTRETLLDINPQNHIEDHLQFARIALRKNYLEEPKQTGSPEAFATNMTPPNHPFAGRKQLHQGKGIPSPKDAGAFFTFIEYIFAHSIDVIITCSEVYYVCPVNKTKIDRQGNEMAKRAKGLNQSVWDCFAPFHGNAEFRDHKYSNRMVVTEFKSKEIGRLEQRQFQLIYRNRNNQELKKTLTQLVIHDWEDGTAYGFTHRESRQLFTVLDELQFHNYYIHCYAGIGRSGSIVRAYLNHALIPQTIEEITHFLEHEMKRLTADRTRRHIFTGEVQCIFSLNLAIQFRLYSLNIDEQLSLRNALNIATMQVFTAVLKPFTELHLHTADTMDEITVDTLLNICMNYTIASKTQYGSVLTESIKQYATNLLNSVSGLQPMTQEYTAKTMTLTDNKVNAYIFLLRCSIELYRHGLTIIEQIINHYMQIIFPNTCPLNEHVFRLYQAIIQQLYYAEVSQQLDLHPIILKLDAMLYARLELITQNDDCSDFLCVLRLACAQPNKGEHTLTRQTLIRWFTRYHLNSETTPHQKMLENAHDAAQILMTTNQDNQLFLALETMLASHYEKVILEPFTERSTLLLNATAKLHKLGYQTLSTKFANGLLTIAQASIDNLAPVPLSSLIKRIMELGQTKINQACDELLATYIKTIDVWTSEAIVLFETVLQSLKYLPAAAEVLSERIAHYFRQQSNQHLHSGHLLAYSYTIAQRLSKEPKLTLRLQQQHQEAYTAYIHTIETACQNHTITREDWTNILNTICKLPHNSLKRSIAALFIVWYLRQNQPALLTSLCASLSFSALALVAVNLLPTEQLNSDHGRQFGTVARRACQLALTSDIVDGYPAILYAACAYIIDPVLNNDLHAAIIQCWKSFNDSVHALSIFAPIKPHAHQILREYIDACFNHQNLYSINAQSMHDHVNKLTLNPSIPIHQYLALAKIAHSFYQYETACFIDTARPTIHCCDATQAIILASANPAAVNTRTFQESFRILNDLESIAARNKQTFDIELVQLCKKMVQERYDQLLIDKLESTRISKPLVLFSPKQQPSLLNRIAAVQRDYTVQVQSP